ncbi:MAG: HEAT repeat domain-containing protein [Phycisphaerae bacterium]|nr:HEAT repeat domain-containing protein [Phycisphaerae bacterium]
MNHNRLIFGLLILGCIIATSASWADTGTVDTEIAAAAKAGPAGLKELERSAIETIKSGAPRMEKDHACRILRVIGTKDSIDALGDLLADEELSHIARYALESMRYPEADKALRDALGKSSGQVKVGIINSLAMRGGTQNVSALLALLNDTDSEIADAAAWALGRIGSGRAVSALSGSYGSAPEKRKAAIADGLLNAAARLVVKGSLPEALAIYKQLQTADAPEHIRMGAFAGTIEAQPDKAQSMLIEAAASDDWKIRGMAIDMIVALEGEGVTERFSANLDKLDAETQVLMLGALVARDEKDALRPVITEAVSSSNGQMRELAIKSLGDIGDASSVQVLVDVIESGKSDEDKGLSTSSLRRLPGKSINGQIVKSMKTSSAEGRVKLIEILQDRDATEAVDELLIAASDKDADIRRAAFKALADLAGPEDQKALIRLLVNLKADAGRAEAERAVISVCRNLDEAAGAEPILAAMDSTTATKCSLLRVLGGIGNAMGFAVVRQGLEDRNPEVRDTAVRTLADWPDASAALSLLEVFQKTSNPTHRIVALRGCVRQLSLGTLASADTLGICGELMKGSDGPQEKKMVLAALAKSGEPGAIEIIEPLLADNDVRAEAELAMLGIIRNMTGPMPDEAKTAAQTLRNRSRNETIKKEVAAVIRLIDKFEDYIMAWQVSGPYSKPFADTFDTAFGPEEADADDVSWKTLPISKTGNRPWMFDLQAAIGGQGKAGYARTWVHCDAEQAARLEFGTDDGNKVWLNGKLVHANNAGGPATPGEHKVPVILQKGWNALLLKVTQDTGTWQFCFAIRKPNGGRLEGLGIQASEPTK